MPGGAQWDALAAATEVAEVEGEARPPRRHRHRCAPGHPQPAPTPATITRRLELSDRFVADVVATLVEAHPDAVVVPAARLTSASTPPSRPWRRAPVIVGGRLPDDEEGRRRGDPAVLVAAGGGGYHPIEVALHRTLERPRSGAPITPVVSSLAAPWLQAAGPLDDVVARPGEGADAEPLVAAKRKGDLLQLAHLRRMLEACGQAASSNVGGVIGTDGIVVWYDLDAPLWTTPRRAKAPRSARRWRSTTSSTASGSTSWPRPRRTPPTRRCRCSWCRSASASAARAPGGHRAGPSWRRATTSACCLGSGGTAGSVTAARRGHHRRPGRARSSHRRARRPAGRRRHLLGAADDADAGLDDDAPLGPLVEAICGDGAEAAAAHLDAAGITTVGELRQLDQRSPPTPVSTSARWRPRSTRPGPADRGAGDAGPGPHRRRRARGDVEDRPRPGVDRGRRLPVGALVTDRAGTGLVTEGYLPFVTWDQLDHPAEVAVFEQLMDWLDGVQSTLAAAGRSWCVYCFNDRAEAGELRRLAASPLASPGRADQVEALVRHPGWVDLLRVAQASIVTGGSMGLKALAPMAGFAWEDDDAGGEQSMGWHDLAVDAADPAVRDANRARLLTYNRNDVEATLALRRWMCTEAAGLPRLDDSDAAWGW
ncbi:MAG: ribonuclease H-like domain-containing protein [Acidimicrobiales bacterium]